MIFQLCGANLINFKIKYMLQYASLLIKSLYLGEKIDSNNEILQSQIYIIVTFATITDSLW